MSVQQPKYANCFVHCHPYRISKIVIKGQEYYTIILIIILYFFYYYNLDIIKYPMTIY